MRNRILIGLLLAVGFVLLLLAGAVVQVIVFSIGAEIAVWEVTRALRQKDLKPYMVPLYAAPVLFLLRLLPGLSVSTYALWSLQTIFLLCALSLTIECVVNAKRSVLDCMAGLFVLVYPVSLFGLLFELLLTPLFQTTMLLCIFVCPLLGDTLAYFVGSAIGKHKLCPDISPKKTVEGAIASLIGSTAGGLLVYALQPFWGSASSLPIVAGVICGFFGQVGDLFASRIKRFAGVKDYSRIFSDHGGVLDRLDSVLFCVPAVYIALYLYLYLFAGMN